MSYDYNALVEEIAEFRKKVSEDPTTYLQKSVDTFATLSEHCPMTPLLWMQYAHDTAELIKCLMTDQPEQSLEMQLQTLQLGLFEFPGCAVLQLYYLQLLLKSNEGELSAKVHAAFQEALHAVGMGSHRNQDDVVATIYRLYTDYIETQGSNETALDMYQNNQSALDLWVQRAETPMKTANDDFMDELHQFCTTYGITIPEDVLTQVEDARRWTAKTFGRFADYEDDVDSAMQTEGILLSANVDQDKDWTPLIQSESSRYLMGLGGAQTAHAFIKYAQLCSHYKMPSQQEDVMDNDEKKRTEHRVHALALAVYERGVSECPTVESLWLSYIRHLRYLISTKHSLAPVRRLKSVTSRAVRNCPYSVQLYQQQIHASLLGAEFGHAVFEPDQLMSIVTTAIQSKFVPNPSNQLELFMTAIRTVKQRIMSMLAHAIGDDMTYDRVESNTKENSATSDDPVLEDSVEQEIQDLIDDVREMYDDTDAFLRKNHASFSEGRTILWKDRAMTESYLLGPLMTSLAGTGTSNGAIAGEGLRCFEMVIKVHQPTHPDSYASYIHATLYRPVSSPVDVLRNLRTVRSLYQKSLRTTGKPKENVASQRDWTTALHSLCFDYLEFEHLFGSDDSHFHASKDVRKRVETLMVNGTKREAGASVNNDQKRSDVAPIIETDSTSASGSKRKLSEAEAVEPVAKKPKQSTPDQDMEMEETTSAPASEHGDKDGDESNSTRKQSVPKVRIGKLEYPAHPFTVRVTNLANETEDMDLVEVFRQKCGAIVHAKIVREKHQHGKGKSKGWGLVQFEDQESVQKALALSDVIGIHERVVKVDRSHVPAVGLVPPGMHRVNPTGEGKSSKRNQKNRERKFSIDQTQEVEDIGTKDQGVAVEATAEGDKGDHASKHNSGSSGILAFRPRGVARKAHRHGSAHHRVKLSLDDDSN